MRKKKKKTRSEKRPFTLEKGKNPERKKKIKNRKREKNETRVGGFEVSAWDCGWVDWL